MIHKSFLQQSVKANLNKKHFLKNLLNGTISFLPANQLMLFPSLAKHRQCLSRFGMLIYGIGISHLSGGMQGILCLQILFYFEFPHFQNSCMETSLCTAVNWRVEGGQGCVLRACSFPGGPPKDPLPMWKAYYLDGLIFLDAKWHL